MVDDSDDMLRFSLSISAIVNTICPTALTLHLSRIDTKASHFHQSIYDADCTNLRWLKLLIKGRSESRSYIREARCGEFDYSPSSGPTMEIYPALQFQSAVLPNEMLRSLWKLIPRLWVLVTDLGAGTHHVSAIYRGQPMWNVIDLCGFDAAVFKSNPEFLAPLSKIQACEGFDIEAWTRFSQACLDACVLDAVNMSTTRKADK